MVCGSRERPDFDHAIPVTEGPALEHGTQDELRCEHHNREEGSRISRLRRLGFPLALLPQAKEIAEGLRVLDYWQRCLTSPDLSAAEIELLPPSPLGRHDPGARSTRARAGRSPGAAGSAGLGPNRAGGSRRRHGRRRVALGLGPSEVARLLRHVKHPRKRAPRRPKLVSKPEGAVSTAGRAPGLHPGGRGFEPLTAHRIASRRCSVLRAFPEPVISAAGAPR